MINFKPDDIVIIKKSYLKKIDMMELEGVPLEMCDYDCNKAIISLYKKELRIPFSMLTLVERK